MKDQVKKFMGKIAGEESLKKRFIEAPSQAEREAIIKDAGFSFSWEEYRQTVKELQSEAGIELITDDKLDKVIGGICSPICSPVNLCYPFCGTCPPQCDPHCKPKWRECSPDCTPDCAPNCNPK